MLDIAISRQSVANILRAAHLPPAGERGARRKRWRAFLSAHWSEFAGIDFASIPIASVRGIHWVNALFVIHLATRRVACAGVHATPDAVVMTTWARNLTMADTGFLTTHGVRYLIRDNDAKYPPAFDHILADAGITIVSTPIAAPNVNAHCERFIGSIQRECLDRIIVVSDDAARRAIANYLDHYHHELPHQGIGHRIIDPKPNASRGPIRCRRRLGGLLTFYHRGPAENARKSA
jgi:transposase InsO family protein